METVKQVAHAVQGIPQTRPEDQPISVSFGPPITELPKQDPATGLKLAGAADGKPKRLIFKRAHRSRGVGTDYRIFDPLTGQVVCVKHQFGCNPYEDHDPHRPPVREGAAHCMVTGAAVPPAATESISKALFGRQVPCGTRLHRSSGTTACERNRVSPAFWAQCYLHEKAPHVP